MGTKKELQEDMNKLSDLIYSIKEKLSEVWEYHPSNPDFINPIKYHKDLLDRLDEVKDVYDNTEREFNSLN